MKRVRDTAAGQKISAYVVMKGSRLVCTIQALHTAGTYGYNTTVNIMQQEEAAQRTAAAMEKHGNPFQPFTEHGITTTLPYFQAGHARGDIDAALGGLYIDGYLLCNHSALSQKPPNGKYFPKSFKPRRGWYLINYAPFDDEGNRVDTPLSNAERRNYNNYATSYFQHAGLRYLRELGYTVISAI